MCAPVLKRSMSAYPEIPGSLPHRISRKANNMIPGVSANECQVAWIHYQQLVNDGLHEQFVATQLPGPASARPKPCAIRHQLAALLTRFWRSLQEVPIDTSKGIGQVLAR